jgi:hypothetical protein
MGHRTWDLWGPLVIVLSLAIILSVDVSYRVTSLASAHMKTGTKEAGDACLLARHFARYDRFCRRHC